ncbi:MAG: metallophosphoesterase [Clostridia bacterium]|nr:metallophosphoesterase [Clostridia bacterium]
MNFNFEALEFSLAIQIFDHGFTDFKITPFGTVRAKTHMAPFKLTIALENVDVNLLQNMLESSPNHAQILENFENQIRKISKIFLFRLLVLALLGGAAGSLLYQRNRLKPLLCGLAVGALVFSVLMVSAFATFDIKGFQNPEYHGALQAAPWMMGLAEQAFVQIDTLGKQLEIMAENFYLLFEKINSLQTLSTAEGSVKVLHVSDYHNNQAALKFVRQVVNSFKVDFVIDTGDFTDYATPIEAQLLEFLKGIPVPYIFIPGNHDSPAIVEKISQFPQVHVISEGVAIVKGLRIIGLHDPASLTNNIASPDSDTINIYQQKLLDLLENNSDEPPHILAIHNYKIGKILAGKVPLILHGHDHQFKIYEEDSTLVIDAGTTGAAGIRGLQATKEIPYTVALLHFQNINGEYKLSAVDSIKIFNLQSGFILERKVVEQQK